jgi:hypothetical protein
MDFPFFMLIAGGDVSETASAHLVLGDQQPGCCAPAAGRAGPLTAGNVARRQLRAGNKKSPAARGFSRGKRRIR